MSVNPPDFYSVWSTRINHLETSRHTLLAAHVATVGYLAKETFDRATLLSTSYLLAFGWFTLVYFLLHCFGALSRNLFLKILMLARQLMKIEYASGAVAAGLGYFSDRSGNEKFKERGDFILLGLAPHVFTAAYFLFSFGIFCAQPSPPLISILCTLAAIMATVWQVRVTKAKMKRLFESKDAEDKGPVS